MVMFFEPGDEKDLARKIIELYQSIHIRKMLVKNAVKFYTEHNWKKYEKIYFNILEELV